MKRRKASALVKIVSQVANAKGYRVFWGNQSRNYAYHQDIGANLSYRVQGLTHGQRYYFSSKTYNDTQTSSFGNEVAFTP